jgi:hypothetical protein
MLPLLCRGVRAPQRPEHPGQSRQQPLVRSYVPGEFAAREGGQIEELLLLVAGRTKEVRPGFQQGGVPGRGSHSAFHFAPIARVHTQVRAATPKSKLPDQAQFLNQFAESHAVVVLPALRMW